MSEGLWLSSFQVRLKVKMFGGGCDRSRSIYTLVLFISHAIFEQISSSLFYKVSNVLCIYHFRLNKHSELALNIFQLAIVI